jgi:hypothetical protein
MKPIHYNIIETSADMVELAVEKTSIEQEL